ncbi:MAG: amidohydrolase family protein, partial [Desulfovibrionaceae bacterium]
QFLGRIPDFDECNIEKHFNSIKKDGVVRVHDMLLVSEEALRKIKSRPEGRNASFWAAPELYESLPPDLQREVAGLKLFTDGSLGARTGAMLQNYRGESNKGLLCYTDARLLESLRRAAELGKAVAMHALGDRALDQILGALRSLRAQGQHLPATRIEHAMFINARQAEEFKRMGVTLSMQPNFSWDSVEYGESLPEGYPEINNPFRMLIDDIGFEPGADLLFGSDGMPTGVDAGLSAALFPPYEGQTLTLDEFVRGYAVAEEPNRFMVEIDHERRQVNLLEPADLREAI